LRLGTLDIFRPAERGQSSPRATEVPNAYCLRRKWAASGQAGTVGDPDRISTERKRALNCSRSSTQNASTKGEWQSSKLIHVNVYNAQNEKIGDIKELMLDKSGKVEDVVIGVGGFIGMGEHDVAIKFDRLKWSDSATTTGSGQPASQSKNADRNYPDHAVLNATKDQLKAMPNFQYSK